MPYYAKKRPLVGSLTTSVSLALMVHGALLLVVIGFTIERVARPSRLTDSSDSLNSVLLQEPGPPRAAENTREAQPVDSTDGVKVAVAIPTVDSAPVQRPSAFQPQTAEAISITLPPRALGNPSPPKVLASAAPPSSGRVPGGGAGNESPTSGGDGAKSGIVAFTNVKGDSAKRIVYVIDGSGSMAVCLPFIRAELLRSVARLDESQSFQLVVFREPPPGSQAAGTFVLNPRNASTTALLAASDLNKSILRDWLENVQPLGRSTPLNGIETALSMQPDLIFLLSRSIKRSAISDLGESNRALLDRLDTLNPVNPVTRKRRTVIKALQFIDDDPTGLMQAIASAHGDAGESYKLIPVPQRFRPDIKDVSALQIEKN